LITKEIIQVHVPSCTGCRSCELACGFHWTKQMDPSRSSIRIKKDSETGKIEVKIANTCNVCRDRETPMCVEVCSPRALSLGRKFTKATK
jgi:Fe-S-cluster-containing hydrogenase component 2